MKSTILLPVLAGLLLLNVHTAKAQANVNLSNLATPTAVNRNLLPATTNTMTLGNGVREWKSLYIGTDIYIENLLAIHSPGGANFFVGQGSGNPATTGANNSAFGNSAMHHITDGAYNVALGYGSLPALTTGDYNVAVGPHAMWTTTTGSYNTATGAEALYFNSTGGHSVAYGAFSLYKNTVGAGNTAVGFSSMRENTTGATNTAVGSVALTKNTTGSSNTSMGYSSMGVNTTGTGSSALGYQALGLNINGGGNTGIGSFAMQNNVSGNFNVGLGRFALSANTTGNFNTAVGYNSDVNGGAFTNSTAIGYNSLATASNQVRIGNTFVTSIGGYAGWSNFSDGRYKKNIKDNVVGLAFINKLKPVTYNLDITGLNNRQHAGKKNTEELTAIGDIESKAIAEKEKIIFTGFVAQDVEKAAKEADFIFSGVDLPKNENDMYGLKYAEFVVPLVKAVQELSLQNDELKQRLEAMEKLVYGKGNANSKLSASFLAQNAPNPFKGNTIISYKLPPQYSKAQIVVYDAAGKPLKYINLSGNGNGSVKLDAATVAAGEYNYSLFVDGHLVDTKRMLSIK